MSAEIAAKLKGVHVLYEGREFVLTGRYDQSIIAKKKPKTLYEIQPVSLYEAAQDKNSKLKVNNSYNKWCVLSQLSLIKDIKPAEEQPIEENTNEQT